MNEEWWRMNEEWWRIRNEWWSMMISSCWGVLITDEQTFVIVELCLWLKNTSLRGSWLLVTTLDNLDRLMNDMRQTDYTKCTVFLKIKFLKAVHPLVEIEVAIQAKHKLGMPLPNNFFYWISAHCFCIQSLHIHHHNSLSYYSMWHFLRSLQN